MTRTLGPLRCFFAFGLAACTEPIDSWDFIALADSRTCGIREVPGPILCWGLGNRRSVPTGDFESISLGDFTVCGLSSGRVDCGTVELASPPGRVLSVALTGELVNRSPAFALLEDGSLFELMPDYLPMSNLHFDERIDSVGPYSMVAADPYAGVVCVLGVDNIPRCCDYNAVSADSISVHAMPLLDEGLRPVAFTSLFGGSRAMCGVQRDGSMRCWGDGAPSTIPDGVFVSGHAGGGAFCGLQESGEVTCSGSDFFGHVSEAPDGRFVQLAFSQSHACAIREGTGELVCWGDGSCASNSTPTYCTSPEIPHTDE